VRLQQLQHAWFIPDAAIAAYRKRRYGHLIDMYGIPKEHMVAAIEQSGGRVLEAVSNTSAGGGWSSFRYCACKARGVGGASA